MSLKDDGCILSSSLAEQELNKLLLECHTLQEHLGITIDNLFNSFKRSSINVEKLYDNNSSKKNGSLEEQSRNISAD